MWARLVLHALWMHSRHILHLVKREWQSYKFCCSSITRFCACTDTSCVCSKLVSDASCTHSRCLLHVFQTHPNVTFELSCTIVPGPLLLMSVFTEERLSDLNPLHSFCQSVTCYRFNDFTPDNVHQQSVDLH